MANVLKRFIRQLEEPLLTEQLRDDFLRVANTGADTAEQQAEDEKLEKYRHLLAKLPAINYNTLRRLVSQFHDNKHYNLSQLSCTLGWTSLHCGRPM